MRDIGRFFKLKVIILIVYIRERFPAISDPLR